MTRLDVGEESVQGATDCAGPESLLLEARSVPLGGIRAMEVHRSLPHRSLPMVGAWCFLDRFGPQHTQMRVEPHPHIGLQTVTWPFVGEVRHRDSVGSDVLIDRGSLNLMTSGEGIAHSEYSTGDGPIELDALQLWVALPEDRRHGPPAFEQHSDLPVVALRRAGEDPAVTTPGATSAIDEHGGEEAAATIVRGELDGVRSPATVYTPLVGAELRIPAGARVVVPLRREWEYALAGITGPVQVEVGAADGSPSPVDLVREHLLYLGMGRDGVEITAPEGATLFLLGGEPFPDDIVMWWNFVGRTHDEIVAAREAWEAGTARFPTVIDHGAERIPAPPLPGVRLTPRRRR